MPIIQINMIEGRTEDQKRKVAEGIAEVLVREANVKEEAIRIIFNDMKGENFVIGKVQFKNLNK